MGYTFAHLFRVLGIKDVPTTYKNTQSNGTIKCMHQTMATLLISWSPLTPQDVLHLVDGGIATTVYLMRSTMSTILKANPGALLFSYEMVLNIPLIAEWQNITHNREALVNNALLKSNQQCINHDYFAEQQVMKYIKTIKGNLAVKTFRPLESVCGHANGNITIQLRLGVTEQINICYTIPYKDCLV